MGSSGDSEFTRWEFQEMWNEEILEFKRWGVYEMGSSADVKFGS